MSIISRLSRLQADAERLGDSLLTVHYVDGRTVRMNGGDAVDLVLSQPDKVSYITATGTRNGLLPELLNGLLRKG